MSPAWALKLWLRAFAPFMPRAGFRWGLLEERDLFTDLLSAPSFPAAPGARCSRVSEVPASRGSAQVRRSGARAPSGGPCPAPTVASGPVGLPEGAGLALLAATELLEASLRLSFSCFPGTVQLLRSGCGDFRRTRSPAGRRGLTPFSGGLAPPWGALWLLEEAEGPFP